MAVTLDPYLNFRDNAREAMEFYAAVFGGDLKISTFKDYHASDDPSEDNKVMHAVLTAPNGITFMAADTPNSMDYQPGSAIQMALGGEDEGVLSGYFQKLADDGGSIIMPLGQAPWGDTFGMLTDKFGIRWMVNIAAKK